MAALLSLIVLVVVAVFFLKRKSIKAAFKGSVGERRIHNTLVQLPEDYEILDNVTLVTAKGTSQIDHVVVSKYGIFAIETKNYRGQIYGSDYMDQWKQIIRTDFRYWRKYGRSRAYTHITKNTFYNPVKQANGHAIALKKCLAQFPKLPIVPIVVFSGDADISTITTSGCVIYRGELLDEIQRYRHVWLTQRQVEDIAEALRAKNVSGEISNREHVRNVKKSIREKNKYTAVGHCPRCGGIMYKKYGTHGAFYACGNFPRCSYAENIKKEE